MGRVLRRRHSSCHTHAPDVYVPAHLSEGEAVFLPRESRRKNCSRR
jgi:hypothetical protein